MKSRVYVTLKAGVLDVQGKAVEGTLHRMGFEDMSGVRVGDRKSTRLNSSH